MQREVLTITSIPSESAAGWEKLLNRLQARGLEETALVVADVLTGLDEARHRVFPAAQCTTHFKRNILRYVKADHNKELTEELREFFLATQKDYKVDQAEAILKEFSERWGVPSKHIRKLWGWQDLHYYLTYLDFDWPVQSMVYTTNWIK